MIEKPYLVFLGDAESQELAKTGAGVRQWAADDCVGQWRMTENTVDLGLPDMRPAEAVFAGARSLLIGVAPPGGALPSAWAHLLMEALVAGLDIVSGLHSRLSDAPQLDATARRLGRKLHDVRLPSRTFPLATGVKRSGKRLLTVGTDCALGKKYTALSLAGALKARGIATDFRATGQTGILISGSGIAIDAVVADFLAGAAESLSPAAPNEHWDVIEGQGSLFHPAYAGVTLGLLHGSQPDALVLCHDPTRTEVMFFPGFPLPTLTEAIAAYLPFARRTNPAARFVAVSLNTASLSEPAARDAARRAEDEMGLPAFDPLRFGLDRAIDAVLA